MEASRIYNDFSANVTAPTALVAQPFDPQNGTLSGAPIPLVNNLRNDVGVWRSIFAVSQNGVMVYQPGGADAAKSHLVWFDRLGRELADYPQETTINDLRALLGVRDVRLSPDNKRVAFASGTGVWTLDFDRKTKTRITFDQQVVQEPAWSPDGKELIFSLQATTGGGDVKINPRPQTAAVPKKHYRRSRAATAIPACRPMENI